MKRVEGTSGIKLIECVSPARNRWRIRWDVQEREDGSASYMEEGFVGRPHMDTIKSVITDWCNEQIDREILSGFLYEGMPVWLSSENQFNYKAAYDLAVQTGGATLPVTQLVLILLHCNLQTGIRSQFNLFSHVSDIRE